MRVTCADPEAGTGGLDPPEKSHKYRVFRNTGPDPLPSQSSMLGHHHYASKTPFKWGFAGRPMMAHF